MAAAKKQAPGTAVKQYDEELARIAGEAKEAESSTMLGKFLSIKGARLKYNGNEVPDGKMNVIVLDSVLENHYYVDDYDADNPSTPVCFAFGTDEKVMAPHEKSSQPQSEQCKGCPQNEFGSADKGKGKACKNVRRLSLITEDALEDVDAAEIAYLKVPVTSVKAWAGYVNQLADTLKRPPLAVVTEISVRPHDKYQVEVQFKLVEQITDGEVIGALLAKREATKEALVFPYVAIERPPADPTPKKPGKYRR